MIEERRVWYVSIGIISYKQVKMKKFRKWIVMISLIIVVIQSSNCFAFDIGAKDLISLGECETLMTYKGTPIRTTYIAYEKDGKHYPAYCLDVTLPGAENGTYQVNGGEKIQNVEVWRAITNGFPYKSVAELGAANEQEAFTATKQAVYTMLYGRDTALYAPVDSDAGRRTYQIYLKIVNDARCSTELIANNLKVEIGKLTEAWQVDPLDKKCVSKTYTINANVSSGNYEIYTKGLVPNGTIVTDEQNHIKNTFKVGEQFKILIPIQNLTQSENFTIEAKANLETKPIVYGSTTIPGRQDYALTGYMYEEINADCVEGYFKNITKIVVIKKEYGTETRLQGITFNLLDIHKQIVQENLVTNDKGEIILENMLPGTYFLQEIETLEGYNLYTDLIEINLDLNEEFQVTVNNTLKNVTEVDKQFELVEVMPTYTETVYNVEKSTTVEKSNEVKRLPVTGY